MLYYNGELVDWQKGKKEIEANVRVQMNDIYERFFGDNAPGYAIVRYPKGTRKKNVSGYYEPVKPYIVDHYSADNLWVFTRYRKRQDKEGREDYVDKFTVIKDPYVIQKKDIEFLWFLMHQSASLKARKIYIEDKEAIAEETAKQMASDVDIKYLIYGKTSPISNDKETFKQVATVYGIKDVNRLGFLQLKNIIYGLVSEGEKNGNRFINFATFEKLVNGHTARRISFIVRGAVNDGSLRFNPKDYKWYFSIGGDYTEELLQLKLKDVPHKEELLIEAALSDGALKGAIFSALGRQDFESDDELREYERKVLIQMGNRYGIETSSKDTKEQMVEKLCKHLNLEYKPKSA